MDTETLAAAVEHTALGPETTPADVRRVVAEAREAGMNACVPPCYLAEAVAEGPDVTLVTVVAFPHGQHAPGATVDEAVRAWEDGADELDVVANAGRLLAGEERAYRDAVEAVVAAVPVPVKVIVVAPRLDEDHLRDGCRLAADAGADFVKTATGFGPGGATVEDVAVMAEYLPVKAAGGIDDYETARAMLDAGAERIGSSAGPAIIAGAPD